MASRYADEAPMVAHAGGPGSHYRRAVWSRLNALVGITVPTLLLTIAIFAMAIVLCVWVKDLRHDVHRFRRDRELADSNDIVALQYALTIERLKSAAADYCTTTYTIVDYQEGVAVTGYPIGTTALVSTIAAHDASHVAAIVAELDALGVDPVPACVYTAAFGTANVDQCLAVMRDLANDGTYALNGAARSVSDPALQDLLATIATTEARQASYLNNLGHISLPPPDSPFPDTFDAATPPTEALDGFVTGPYITSCPYTPEAPITRPNL